MNKPLPDEVDTSEADFRNKVNEFDENDKDLLNNYIKNDICFVECFVDELKGGL